MLIKIEIPEQDSEYGYVSSRTIIVPVTTYEEVGTQARWHIDLPTLPMEEAIEDDGTRSYCYVVGYNLIMAWTQDGVSCGETLRVGASEVDGYPRLF